MRSSTKRWASVLAVASLLATGVTVVSSGVVVTSVASAASSCVTQATANVKKAEAAPKAKYPTVQFNMKANKGKSVWLIAPDNAGIVATIIQQDQIAADAAGVRLHVFNANATISGMNQGVTEAVAAGANGIILLAVAESYIPTAVAAATAAHIPIVDTFNGSPGDPLPAGVFAHVTSTYLASGATMADYALEQTQCNLTGAILTSSLYNVFAEVTTGIQNEVAALCPSCSIDTVQIPNIGAAATEVPQLVSSELTAKPATTYFFAPSDNVAGLIDSAITANNDAGKVFVIGHDGTTSVLDNMRFGSNEVADAAWALKPLGWEMIDAIGRAMAHAKAVPENVPAQLLTVADMPNSDTNLFNSVANPVPVFKNLWKLAKATITCVKGKVVKRVTAITPRCPVGFHLK